MVFHPGVLQPDYDGGQLLHPQGEVVERTVGIRIPVPGTFGQVNEGLFAIVQPVAMFAERRSWAGVQAQYLVIEFPESLK